MNTCGFIGDAKEESIAAIFEAVQRKQAGLVGQIYVCGCLSQRYISELPELIPEVDKWFGARCRKKTKKEPDAETAAAIALALSDEMSPEVYAAIGMALEEYLDEGVHDYESYIITIKRK